MLFSVLLVVNKKTKQPPSYYVTAVSKTAMGDTDTGLCRVFLGRSSLYWGAGHVQALGPNLPGAPIRSMGLSRSGVNERALRYVMAPPVRPLHAVDILNVWRALPERRWSCCL